MPVLTLALVGGAAAFLFVSWASWSAGYGPEVALLRGILGFGAFAIVGYVGELIVVTQAAATARAAALRAAALAARPTEEPSDNEDGDGKPDADERAAA